MTSHSSHTPHHRQHGFTLTEVLIAVVLLSIGLLSMAQMQANGLRSAHSAYLRSQATILAGDILDSMRANFGTSTGPVLSGDYDLTFTEFSALPSTGTSTAEQYLILWKDNVTSLFPNGGGQIARAGNTVSVSIRWKDSRQNEVDQAFRIFQVDTTL